MAVITNDIYSPLEAVLPSNNFIKLGADQDVPQLPQEIDVIFDFGGYVDSRVISALEDSQAVIIPTTANFIDLQVTLNAIKEIERFNSNIIIVANRTTKKRNEDDYKTVQSAISKFFKYPVIEIKELKALPNLFSEKISISKMVAQGGLKAYNFKKIANQFNTLINIIKDKI